MKIRNGFVSNSSSSSFMVVDISKFTKVIELLDTIDEDYYIYDNRLYTSFIYENKSRVIRPYADSEIDGAMEVPYNLDSYVEKDGKYGRGKVYIPKIELNRIDQEKLGIYVPTYKLRELWEFVKSSNRRSLTDKDFRNICTDLVRSYYENS